MNKRQQQAAATREQLLASAREVFEERGYQAATVGGITDRANTAHGTFYLYFKNKEDAFCQVMEDVMNLLYEESGGDWGDPPRVGIDHNLRAFLRVFAEHAGLWRALLEGMLQSAKIEHSWLQLRRAFIDRIRRRFEGLQQTGDMRPIDPVIAAHALGAMTEWLAFTQFVLDEPGTDHASLDELVDGLTDLWFHAVYRQPPDTTATAG